MVLKAVALPGAKILYSNIPLIVKTGCAHSRQKKNNPCTMRKNDVYSRPASNRKHAPALRIYHRLRTHTRLRRRKGPGRQRSTHPDGTRRTTPDLFPSIPRHDPPALNHSLRAAKPLAPATVPGLRKMSRPHHLD